uniref:Xanthine dehydrogenase accessory factor n=1 Tax=Candidatus Kentrum sp. MB TaxID=2138164 RepID=A0A451BF62_9GAMM|nr:MAG: xanthine dehydrogenase accessory factor [Candidatus Kentron sp. MB]VFK76925.1 MAG: xanthine dehydrogenase accessory factor [Candidatus Kentron sp. MB]
MKDNNAWQLVHDCLHKSIPLALLIVVESHGSTPGRVGFKMAVAADGRLAGTIGGGAVEHDFINEAKAKLKGGDLAPVLRRRIHNHDSATDGSGMICGGTQTIAFYPCQKTDLAVVRRLIKALENREKGVLGLFPLGILFIPNRYNKEDYRFDPGQENQCRENIWLYEENINRNHTIYIIGGGHVGLALSRVLATLDFYIVILDERTDADTFNNNRYANEKITVSYEEIAQHIPDGEQNHAVIMTPDHRADKLVLRELLPKKLHYLGMMGSSRKVREVFDQLREEGVSPEKLQGIHAPIGLPIKSHTPAEIAISIAAEIIACR